MCTRLRFSLGSRTWGGGDASKSNDDRFVYLKKTKDPPAVDILTSVQLYSPENESHNGQRNEMGIYIHEYSVPQSNDHRRAQWARDVVNARSQSPGRCWGALHSIPRTRHMLAAVGWLARTVKCPPNDFPIPEA